MFVLLQVHTCICGNVTLAHNFDLATQYMEQLTAYVTDFSMRQHNTYSQSKPKAAAYNTFASSHVAELAQGNLVGEP
jgi:hypothetical protein